MPYALEHDGPRLKYGRARGIDAIHERFMAFQKRYAPDAKLAMPMIRMSRSS
jgi:hypothetical protein